MNSTLFNLTLAGYILAGIFYLINQVFKSRKSGTAAVFLLSAGFLFHTLFLLKRWQEAGHFPVIGLYETLVFSVWCLVLVYLILCRHCEPRRGEAISDRDCFVAPLRGAPRNDRNEVLPHYQFLGIPVSLSAILILGYTSILDKSVQPLMPALKSNWITIHVISYFMGYGGLLISFIVSLIYLFARQRDAAFAKKMDGLSSQMVSFAFPFLTIGLTTGAIWAKNAWGRYWSWDPKETWALITWLIYAAYLHLRLNKNWQGKKAAILNIIGFLCVLFTFLGVNYWMKGLHSYL